MCMYLLLAFHSHVVYAVVSFLNFKLSIYEITINLKKHIPTVGFKHNTCTSIFHEKYVNVLYKDKI